MGREARLGPSPLTSDLMGKRGVAVCLDCLSVWLKITPKTPRFRPSFDDNSMETLWKDRQ